MRRTWTLASAYSNELPQLAECLPEINAPVLIIAGRRDRVVPLASAEFSMSLYRTAVMSPATDGGNDEHEQ